MKTFIILKHMPKMKFEDFENFWVKYPKKVGKKIAFKKFMKIDLKNKDNLFIGLDLYLKKWNKEKIDIQFIPNPATFLNQERRFDEIIIEGISEEEEEKRQKRIEEKKQEDKKENEERQKIQKKYDQLINFYNSLSDKEKRLIHLEAKKELEKTNIKKGLFYEKMKKITIKKIVEKKYINY